MLNFDSASCPSAGVVTCTNSVEASKSGYAVHFSAVGSETAGGIGRVSERARYRLGAGQARQHAALAAGLELGDDGVIRERSGPPLVPSEEVLRWDKTRKDGWMVSGLCHLQQALLQATLTPTHGKK